MTRENTTTTEFSNRPRFYYGWWVVIVSFVTICIALGIRYSFGVFFVAILDEYPWGRGQTAGAFSLAMLMHAAAAPFTGYLVDRFGPRILFPAGAALLGAGLILAGTIHALWQLYVFFGVIMAVGINAMSFSPHMTIVPRWFQRRRGLASGMVLAGIGMGGLAIAPLSQILINHFGWRTTFFIFGLMTMIILIPLTRLVHRKGPDEVGQYPDGDPAPVQTNGTQAGNDGSYSTDSPIKWTLGKALTSRSFLLLIISNTSYGFLLNMMVVHQAAKMVDVGYGRNFAAVMVGLTGLLSAVGGILIGNLTDRVERRTGFLMGSMFVFVGVLLIMSAQNTGQPWLVYGYAVFWGLGYGSLPTIQGAMTGDIFSGPILGRIMGFLSIGFGCGGALGAYLAGYFHDQTNNYTIPFVLALVSIIMSLSSFWLLGAYREKEKANDRTV